MPLQPCPCLIHRFTLFVADSGCSHASTLKPYFKMAEYSSLYTNISTSDQPEDTQAISQGVTPESIQLFDHSLPEDTDHSPRNTVARRIGLVAIASLFLSSLVVLGATSVLIFLWTSGYNNMVWHLIMVRQWATRIVTISALLIRTATSLQTGLAVAMLVSLLLESGGRVKLRNIPIMSVARASGSTSLLMLRPVISGLSISGSIRTNGYLVALLVLFATSTLLQFSSTALVSDLSLGQLPGLSVNSSTGCDLEYAGADEPLAFGYLNDDWKNSPRIYMRPPTAFPTFAEYSEPIEVPSGVDDTGLLLRAFLPFRDVQSRENLRNYSGKAQVLDSRVSCQPPHFLNAIVSVDQNSQTFTMTGSLLPSRNVTGLWTPADPVPYNCTFNAETPSPQWGLSICTIYGPDPSGEFRDTAGTGGFLSSQFRNTNQTYQSGSPFLLFTRPDSIQFESLVQGSPWSITNSVDNGPWLSVIYSPKEPLTVEGSPFERMTLCYTAWDTARLQVDIHGNSNRTEPSLFHGGVTGTYYTRPNISAQLNICHGNRCDGSKPEVMSLDTPRTSWRPDLEDELDSDTPFVLRQADMDLVDGSEGGAKVAFTFPNDNYDPTLTELFLKFFSDSGSPAQVLSSMITILSSMAYYDQVTRFDYNCNGTATFFTTVVYPQSSSGLTAFLVILTAHLLLVAAATIAFVLESKYTLIGNYWQAIAQLRSPEIDGILAVSSMLKDNEVARKLKRAGRDDVEVGVGISQDDNRVKVFIK
jgi:hypothetical protein